jgi:hypothetical protein
VGRQSWKVSFREGDSFRDRSHHPAEPEAETGEPCARGNRCEERDYQGNAKCGPRAFCSTDRDYIGRAIYSLPETYTQLRVILARSEQAGERVSGSRDLPIPVAADVDKLMREIVWVACSWEEVVRAVARLSDYPDGHRRDAVALADACRTLYRHLDTLLSLAPQDVARSATRKRVEEVIEEFGDETGSFLIRYDTAGDAWENVTMDGTQAGMEFLAITGKARGMIGLNRQRRRITEVPCDQCKARTLVQYEALLGGWEPKARCTNCPNAYTGQLFEFLMGRVYEVQVATLNAEELKRRVAAAAA